MRLLSTVFITILTVIQSIAQSGNEFYNNGAEIKITSGAELHVIGDVHNYVGTLSNDGLLVVQGDMYSDNLFQQRGTGTTRLINASVNIGQPQFISGSYAVRGGQSNIGVNDGSFYNLELCNDVGIVWLDGTGNVADVRNSVDFNGPGSPTVNRIITHDPTALPLNGDGYSAVFGIMNPATGLANMPDNTVSVNGNVSALDNGYIQGKLRRAIAPAGGWYSFVLGLEPGGVTDQRGMQYSGFTIDANNYDCITGYFMTGLDNTVPGSNVDCSGYQIDYFGGSDHGQWVFEDLTGIGTGTYEMTVWPQDHNMPAKSVWLITKDNLISGTTDDCGPSYVGLSRSGFDGFSQFGVAGSDNIALSAELIQIWAESEYDHIQVNWTVAFEENLVYYVLERSTSSMEFDPIATIQSDGNTTQELNYSFDDYEVMREEDYFYRYRSVDNDGSIEYSPVVHGKLSESFDGIQFELFPNPGTDDLTILMDSDQNRQLEISLYNNLGQMVSQREIILHTGTSAVPVEIVQLARGVYTFRITDTDSGKIVTKRFIKQ